MTVLELAESVNYLDMDFELIMALIPVFCSLCAPTIKITGSYSRIALVIISGTFPTLNSNTILIFLSLEFNLAMLSRICSPSSL
ncbi:hypothetical protein OGAPHI_000536 [Ogataea philodendri]|uniref:Uncharacterized protein n=1 Tax=Ogataea philodendri TaxID=1378263 RepID=A0A9P8T9F8_9ASCO|nr:uncharacterized protein OGAPHI_000536 [Ogataea philodendri]KAH3671313.1 hypothetical protein OGAPHI_000536 [Ogataea philodendri]